MSSCARYRRAAFGVLALSSDSRCTVSLKTSTDDGIPRSWASRQSYNAKMASIRARGSVPALAGEEVPMRWLRMVA